MRENRGNDRESHVGSVFDKSNTNSPTSLFKEVAECQFPEKIIKKKLEENGKSLSAPPTALPK